MKYVIILLGIAIIAPLLIPTLMLGSGSPKSAALRIGIMVFFWSMSLILLCRFTYVETIISGFIMSYLLSSYFDLPISYMFIIGVMLVIINWICYENKIFKIIRDTVFTGCYLVASCMTILGMTNEEGNAIWEYLGALACIVVAVTARILAYKEK